MGGALLGEMQREWEELAVSDLLKPSFDFYANLLCESFQRKEREERLGGLATGGEIPGSPGTQKTKTNI